MNSETYVRISVDAIRDLKIEAEALDHITTAMLGSTEARYHDAGCETIRNLQARIRNMQRLIPDAVDDLPF